MPPTLEDAVRAALEPIAGISAVVLLGSRALGTPRPDSDLDVAVLPEPGSGPPPHRLIGAVAAALAGLAPEGRVDVVLLDAAPELLRHRILSHGRRLLCRDERAWKDLLVRTMREHGDREHYRDILRKGLHRRLTEGEDLGRSGRAVESLERLGKLSD